MSLAVSLLYTRPIWGSMKRYLSHPIPYPAACGKKYERAYKHISGTNHDKVRELHEHVVDLVGPPTILINNAGANCGYSLVKSIDEVDIEAFERTWRINCGSAYLLTQLCMPAMEGEGAGRVIFISSVAGITGGIVGPHYASSKSALHGLIHWIAQTYAKKGITVNGIAPALIEQTKILPGSSEELSSSKRFLTNCLVVRPANIDRNPNWKTWNTR